MAAKEILDFTSGSTKNGFYVRGDDEDLPMLRKIAKLLHGEVLTDAPGQHCVRICEAGLNPSPILARLYRLVNKTA